MTCRQFLFLAILLPALAHADKRDITFSTRCDTRNDLATVSIVGDVLVHKALYESVVSGSKKFSQIWKKTNPLIQKADFSVANLEGPAALGIDHKGRDHGDIGFVYDGTVYSGTNFVFNYHPQILRDLVDSGYDLLTMANNHALDRGFLGIDRTIATARTLALPTVGVRMSTERNAEFFSIAKIKELNVAFIGCTEMINGNDDSKDQVLACYKGQRLVAIIKELAARPDVDAVIVLPHWGQEYQPLPDESQKLYARRFIEAGALAVVGSHPHVLEPWEKYTAKDGHEGLIVYSLGNFVAGQPSIPKQTGAVAYLGLSRQGNQKAQIFGVAYTPTYREGAEIFPIGSTSAKEVLTYAAQNFGTINRLEPAAPLMEKICR
ncbi:CapA family protein [Bdellovibrio svalbardensis]|uniref:CapA family protein n=1 Tax=Bdellovibrio svalbardensis TaxID=2972972 RepID=A0ABT6DJ50_9BACT|nr:CapA family protein [Bdellovibrio svalbardensis]MDG0816880.1 CapA family protein [Bdellovibrio svalbardensis]